MGKKLWSNLLIISVFFSLLTSECKNEEDTEYVFTGRVTDQVTGQPVSGATIWYGHLEFGESDIPLKKMAQYALSGADGRFTLLVPKELIDDYRRYPGPVIFAEHSSFVGSNIPYAPKGGENMNLELYRSSQLYLHVQNDTITNQIDETMLWIVGDRDFWVYPGFNTNVVMVSYPNTQFRCKGKDYDTIIIIKQLWGNLTYSVSGGAHYILGPKYFSKNIKLLPDEINYLSVSF